MTSEDDWVAEIAAKTAVDDDAVRHTLSRYGISGRRPTVSRRQLRLEGVHFAGVKDIAVSKETLDRALVPFTFTHRFDQLLTAFATASRNDAGKTSVVNVTEWGLRGNSGGLQADVRGWIRQAVVGFRIADERLLVAWNVRGGAPSGAVVRITDDDGFDWGTADERALPVVAGDDTFVAADVAELLAHGAELLSQFDGADEFQAVMSEIMGPRVGFDERTIWQRFPKGRDEDDGGLASQGWPLWSQALVISDAEKAVVLGETAVAATAVLSMYLGTGWGASASAAVAQMRVVRGQLAPFNRRSTRQAESSSGSTAELEQLLKVLTDRLAALPEADSFEQIQRELDRTRALGATLAAAEQNVAEAAASRDEYETQLVAAGAELAALREAAQTSRFWNSLTPTCCPRCDAKVGQQQLLREAEGHCSLCNSELDDEGSSAYDAGIGAGVDDEDEEPDSLTATSDRVRTLELEMATAQVALTLAEERRDAAQQDYSAAAQALTIPTETARRRRDLELEIATLRGQLSERQADAVEDEQVTALRTDFAVLEAAQKVINEWKLDDQRELLVQVSTQVTDIARRLGVLQLESAELRSNATLVIRKGGERTTFSAVNAGEQLRFKIAVVIALMRIGGRAGVSRHPGVLFIDSFAREEMSADNAVSVLQALQSVAEEFDIHIVTSSANGLLLQTVLPAGAVRMATAADDAMW